MVDLPGAHHPAQGWGVSVIEPGEASVIVTNATTNTATTNTATTSTWRPSRRSATTNAPASPTPPRPIPGQAGVAGGRRED